MTWIDPKLQFSERSFRNQLRSKSRNRREQMARLGATSAKPGGMRNDPLPRLLLDDLPLEDLRLPRRAFVNSTLLISVRSPTRSAGLAFAFP